MSKIFKQIDAHTVHHLPIIKAYADKIQLVEIINQLIPNEKIVDHGTMILAMVIDTLTGRNPLYRLEEFYSKQDTELLLGKKIHHSELTDDSIGRTLDAIYDYGSMKIFSAIALYASKVFEIISRYIHFDTTSKSVFGDYRMDVSERNAPNITNGYSKDKRPDLKQFIMGILCAEGSVPIFGMIEDGNASDKKTNNKLLTKIKRIMSKHGIQDNAFIYVADSAVVTEDNLNEIGKNYLITRLPATYKECGRVITEAVLANQWVEIGPIAITKPTKNRPIASYKAYETCVELYGNNYRAVVVHSSAHDKRRKKRVEKELLKAKEALEKIIKKEAKLKYFCDADAQAVVDRLKAINNVYYEIDAVVEKELKYGPGRPGPNREPQEIKYCVKITINENEESIEKKREEAGCFVLFSNLPKKDDKDPMGHNPEEILRSYKEQHGVERNFTFLKDPMIVNSIFLKKQERIEVLGLVFLLSLLIWSLMERSMRQYIEEKETTLTGFDKKQTDRPTSFMMTTKFFGVIVLKIGNQRGLGHPLDKVQRSYLKALGLSSNIFTNIKPG
jgi:transposase